MPDFPLISCVMPTKGRPTMARQALGCFLAQTYPNKELVIFDDFGRPSFGQIPVGDEIRYMQDTENRACATKRNIINEAALGPIICHWDDDDLSHPLRLEDQYQRLIASGAEVTGYHSGYFLSESGKVWKYTGWDKHYGLGSSLMYWKRFWESRPFTERQESGPVMFGSDTIWIRGLKIAAVDAGMMLIARNHGGNLNDRSDAKLAEAQSSWKLCPQGLFATA